LEWTRTSLEQSLSEFYTIFLEEHLQVALKMLDVGIFLTLVTRTDQSGSVMFRCGGPDLHALQIMTEQFQVCDWEYCFLGKVHHCSEIMSGSWDSPDYPSCLRTPLQ
jgi:hypothetical protein